MSMRLKTTLSDALREAIADAAAGFVGLALGRVGTSDELGTSRYRPKR